MIWREIRQNDEIFALAETIWQVEQSLPRWFGDAAKTWLTDLDHFRRFITECPEIYGMFDERGEFYGCIYFEQQSELENLTVHLSIIRKISPSILVRKCSELRDMAFHRGVRKIRGWILKKNFALCRILAMSGFRSTDLFMDYGESRGRTLRWVLIEAVRG